MVAEQFRLQPDFQLRLLHDTVWSEKVKNKNLRSNRTLKSADESSIKNDIQTIEIQTMSALIISKS